MGGSGRGSMDSSGGVKNRVSIGVGSLGGAETQWVFERSRSFVITIWLLVINFKFVIQYVLPYTIKKFVSTLAINNN